MTAVLASSFPALGTTAAVLVSGDDPGGLAAARTVLEAELASLDVACSRFRCDSELTRANDAAGKWVVAGPLLAEAIGAALRAARLTGGAVDPTVGPQLAALGYDRTFDEVKPCEGIGLPAPVRGWPTVDFDQRSRALRVPVGTRLDLGATAKALAADRAAPRCAAAAGCGVLINLGGDIATAGPASSPAAGWQVRVSDDHRSTHAAGGVTVALAGGALATSSTTVRAWRNGDREVHHIIDPATGDNPAPVWRTASVAAATCVDANTAATAAIVMGLAAPRWLAERRLPSRLVALDGSVTLIAGWPAGVSELADG